MAIEYRIAKGSNYDGIIVQARRCSSFDAFSDLDRLLTQYANNFGRNVARQEFVPEQDRRVMYILNQGCKPGHTEETADSDIALKIYMERDLMKGNVVDIDKRRDGAGDLSYARRVLGHTINITVDNIAAKLRKENRPDVRARDHMYKYLRDAGNMATLYVR